jgi:hypothetical protein
MKEGGEGGWLGQGHDRPEGQRGAVSVVPVGDAADRVAEDLDRRSRDVQEFEEAMEHWRSQRWSKGMVPTAQPQAERAAYAPELRALLASKEERDAALAPELRALLASGVSWREVGKRLGIGELRARGALSRAEHHEMGAREG